MSKRLKIQKRHADRNDCETRVGVAFAEGLRQGIEGGYQEAKKEDRVQIDTLRRRVAELESLNEALARERNRLRQQAMDASEKARVAERHREAALDLIRQYNLVNGVIPSILGKRRYVTRNGVMIDEGTARSEEAGRTLEQDLADAIARNFESAPGAPEIVLTSSVVTAECRLPYFIGADEASGEDQTAITIYGPGGQFSHFEYPEEDEALGRDRSSWGPGGQEQEPYEGHQRFDLDERGLFCETYEPGLGWTGRVYDDQITEASTQESDGGYLIPPQAQSAVREAIEEANTEEDDPDDEPPTSSLEE